MNNKKDLKGLDRNQLIIMWGDLIVINSNHLGHVSRESFMLDWVFDAKPPTPEQVIMVQNDPARKIRDEFLRRLKATAANLDLIGKELESNLTGVKNHLLSHRYIKDPVITESFWRLTERGDLMKELGGHRKFQRYRRRELRVLQNQQTNTILLIFATALAAIMPFVVAHFYPPVVTVNVPPPSQRPTHSDTVLLRQLVEEELKHREPTPIPKAPTKHIPPKPGGKQ
jgi:hypothetical protein